MSEYTEMLEELEKLIRKFNQSPEKGVAGDTRLTRVSYTDWEIEKVENLIAKAKE